jgi:hypothetical protein
MGTWRGETYRFTVTAATAAAGDTYTNNGQTFTVVDAIAGGTILYCFGTGTPSAAPSTLVRATGAGTNPISYSAFTTPNTNWGTSTNWSDNTVPTASIDAIFDANSRDCVLNADRVCRDLIFTAFPSPRTVNLATFNLSPYRSVTLQSDISSRVIGTTGTLRMAQTTGGTILNGTITPNGGTWPLNFTGTGAAITITLAANFTVAGNVLLGTGTTYSGNSFFIGGNLSTTGGTNTLVTSSTNFFMNGSGTLSMVAPCNLEINTAGTITVLGNISAGRKFVITSVGTLSLPPTTNFTFIPSGPSTIDFGPGNKVFQDFTTNTVANGTTTILSSFTCRDISLIVGTYNGPTSPLNAIITITRNYSIVNLVTATNGTLSLVMEGTSVGGGSILNNSVISRLPLSINAGTNTISLGAAISIFQNAVLTRNSGNINVGTSTLSFQNGASVTINNMVFWNVFTNVNTITQNVLNTINGTLTINGNNTFNGTAGWTCANLICSTPNAIITLQNLITYTTTTSVNMLGSNAQKILMTSNAAGARAIWTFNGNNQSMVYVSATRIDSDLGQTIWSFGGVIALTPLPEATRNWNPGTKPETQGITFVN